MRNRDFFFQALNVIVWLGPESLDVMGAMKMIKTVSLHTQSMIPL